MEGRNYTGVQLIDRNDELCILYEKANIQEQTLKKGRNFFDKEGRFSTDTEPPACGAAEADRGNEEAYSKHAEYAAKILSLQEQLKDEEEVVQALCENLENPANLGRWRPAGER